jgi:tetratricopeptide (TPR) repeat protein
MPATPDPDQILQQAYAAHQARRHAEAERLYRNLLEMSPDDIDGNNLLGLLYIECRQFAKAREVIRKAIAIRPDDPHSHYNIGIASKECGDAAAAIEHFQESARLAPENIEAWVALGNMQKLERRYSEAAESYRQAIAINAFHAAAKAGLSDTLNDAGVERLTLRTSKRRSTSAFYSNSLATESRPRKHSRLRSGPSRTSQTRIFSWLT